METDPEVVMVIDLKTLVYSYRLLTSTPIEKRLADGLKLNSVMQFKDDKLWDEKPFGLKDLLEERGMSVYRLTKNSGLSNRTVERVVKGEQSIGQMSLDNADALAHALGYENATELKKDLAFRNRRYTF